MFTTPPFLMVENYKKKTVGDCLNKLGILIGWDIM